MTDLAEAQAALEAAWGAHDQARGPMRDDLLKLIGDLEGVTGLPPSPGAERLVDGFLDYAEFHADTLGTAAQARADALTATTTRDEAVAAQPAGDVPPVPTMLQTADQSTVRAWLRDADDVDVRTALDSLLDADEQRRWAKQLLSWARADGTTAQVLTAINEHITAEPVVVEEPSGDAVAQVGGSSTYSAPPEANPDNEPASDATVEQIMGWVGTDVGRARVRYDAETAGLQRPDVLAALVDVLDTDHGDVPGGGTQP